MKYTCTACYLATVSYILPYLVWISVRRTGSLLLSYQSHPVTGLHQTQEQHACCQQTTRGWDRFASPVSSHQLRNSQSQDFINQCGLNLNGMNLLLWTCTFKIIILNMHCPIHTYKVNFINNTQEKTYDKCSNWTIKMKNLNINMFSWLKSIYGHH